LYLVLLRVCKLFIFFKLVVKASNFSRKNGAKKIPEIDLQAFGFGFLFLTGQFVYKHIPDFMFGIIQRIGRI